MDVPIEMIFEYPTIEQLAEKLYSNTLSEAAEQHISRLNQPKGRNLFCFPPISGFGIFFKDLAAALNGRAAVYGFNFIEEDSRMEQYIDKMLEIQPEGLTSSSDIQRAAIRHSRLQKRWKSAA